jgi:hypothetical protein
MQPRMELMDLAAAIRLPGNPKDHDLTVITRSVERFGFLEPPIINDVTGHVISGHGRMDTLQGMKATGKTAPDGVKVEGDKWIIPSWHVSVLEKDEYAVAVGLNKTVELGGWHEDILVGILSDLAARNDNTLLATGYDRDDVDALLKMLNTDFIEPQEEIKSEVEEIEEKPEGIKCQCPQCNFEFSVTKKGEVISG